MIRTPLTPRPRSGLRLLAIVLSAVCAAAGVSVATPAIQALADTAQRTSWNATSTQSYTLHNNNGSSWAEMDASRLSLTITPAITSDAVLAANTDLFTSSAGVNTDVAIEVNNSVVVWKEAGGYSSYAPAAVFAQDEMLMTAGSTYTVALYWKTNVAQPVGAFSQAGAGLGPTYSPTVLSALLTPDSLGFVAAASSAITYQASTSSTSWVSLPASTSTAALTATVTTGASSGYDALVTANADTFTATGGVNQDLGICYATTASFGTSCPQNGVVAYQENGGAGAYKPVASLVQAHLSLAANTNYEFGVVYKANGSGAIYAGAGTNPYSASSIIVQLTPAADSEVAATTQSAQEQRPYSTGDVGTSWESVPNVSSLSLTPSVNVLTYLDANATLFADAGGYNIDLGVCVTSGTQTCDGAGTHIVGWKESGSATAYSPDASFLHAPFYMQPGTAYTVTLQWRTNVAMAPGDVVFAGTGSSPNASSLVGLEVPSSPPSVPQAVSATAGTGQAMLTWSAPASSPGSPLSGYAITPYLGNTALETEDIGLVSSFTVPNLSNGETYTFTVAGINGYGAGTKVTTGAVTPGLPGAPTSVTAGTTGNGTVSLSWTAPSATGASALTGYSIATNPATITTYSWGTSTATTIGGLANGTSYTFAVAAVNAFGTGPSGTSGSKSPTATVPGAPTGVVGTAGNASATVTWSSPGTNGGSSITSYTITPYIGNSAQSTASCAAPCNSKTVGSLSNGTAYTFTVKAVNAKGAGAESSHSWTVIPAHTAVIPAVALVMDKGANAIYGIGTVVTYTATLTVNTGAQATVSYQDALPTGLSGAGALITVNGAACASPVACSAGPASISVSSLTIPASGHATVTYEVTVTGTARSCSPQADNASVTIAGGNSSGASASLTACDSDLGTNSWNSYITQTLGDGGSAGVNPANGNLVVNQTDAIPMATEGIGTFHLQRTYNSQDTDLAGLAEPEGAGWLLSFVEMGNQPGGVALLRPAYTATNNAAPITLVDGTGARYAFNPQALRSVLNVSGLSTGGTTLGTVPPRILSGGTNTVCVDEVLTPPTGIHESMWRYVQTTSSSCNLATAPGTVLGYVTLGVDRVRREFNSNGQLLSVQDSAGNQFVYGYSNGQLASVTEAATGRAFAITTNGSVVTIKDPGGESTTFTLTGGNLTAVGNPDGTSLTYSYGGCTGSAVSQLCGAADGRGHSTTFTYTPASAGPAMVASVTDRAGNTSSVTYNASNVTSDRSSSLSWNPLSERTNYASIDASGRVAELDEGSTANAWLHQTIYTWDTASAGCRQPDAGVDNDLCSIIRRGLTPGAPDRVTYYSYGDEGQMLSQRDLDSPTDIWTTAGYQEQYFELGSSIATYTDTVGGSGTVNSTTQSGGRHDSATLFDVLTQTQSLTPRGNGAGSGYSAFLTTYTVDNAALSPNWTNGTSVCQTPASPSSNTGLACEDTSPSYDGTHPTDTYFTYNLFGQRATVVTPNGDQYSFTYYANSDKDLSGAVTAAGWLKGIIDPTQNFIASAYDAEGHAARNWDRLATSQQQVPLSSADWNTLADTSQVGDFSEALYTNGLDSSTATFSAPGRYPVASRTAQGDWTTKTYDSNGNAVGSRTAVGTSGLSTSSPSCPQPTLTQTYDTCRTYDSNDNLLSTLTPMEADTNNYGSQMSTTYTYDAFDNRVSTTNADGRVTYDFYDSANRLIETLFSRGYGRQMTQFPNNCSAQTGGGWPFYDAAIYCSTHTSYDGVDNLVSSVDANGSTTSRLYDAVHREIESLAPRNDGTFTTLDTVELYDADGNLTDVCSPREMSEGSTDSFACTSTATYGTHTTYTALDKKASTYTYQVAGTRLATTYAYDGDGNQLSTTNANGNTTSYSYNNLDEKTGMTVPRDATHSYTTTYGYDASGDEISEYAPIAGGTNTRNFEWSYDLDHRVVYSIVGASGPPPDANVYNPVVGTDVRTQTLYDADGNVRLQYQPDAFAGSGSLHSPNSLYSVAATYNADDEQTAVYKPRYDTSTLADPVGSGQTAAQSTECPTGYTSQGFSSTTGVCVTTYTYDPVGNVARVTWPTDPGGNTTTSNSYTDDNLLFTMQAPSPANGSQETTATYYYDADGKQTDVIDANGLSTTTAYTADGLAASTTATPNGTTTHVTTYGYDAGGDQTSVADALGNVSTTSYLPNGWRQSAADAAGDVTSYVYDAVGNPIQVKSPSANALDSTNPRGDPTYNWYTADNLLAATLMPFNDGSSGVNQRGTCYYYDQSGRKTNQGNVTTVDGFDHGLANPCPTQPGSTAFTFVMQPDDRLAAETGRNGSSTLSFQYDAAGNQVSSTDSTSNVTMSTSYYADNRTRTAGDGEGRTTNYAYDGAGNVTGRDSVPSGGTTFSDTINYTKADLQGTETTSVAPGVTSWFYDAGGRPTTETYGNGDNLTYGYAGDGSKASEVLWNGAVGSSTQESSFTQTVDGDYHVIADGCVCDNSSGANVGHSFNYAYDQAGRLIFVGASAGASAFQMYDHDGNRLVHTDVTTGTITSYGYNQDDSVATATANGVTTSSTYDSNGGGTLVNDGCVSWTLDTFDRASQLSAVANPPSSCVTPAPPTTTYTYNAAGRPVTESTSSAATTVHNDQVTATPIVEDTSSGGTTFETAYGRDRSGVPQELAQGSTTEFLSNDPKGDLATSMTTSNSVQCQLQYDPYATAVFTQSSSSLCETGSTIDDLLYQNVRRDSSSGDYQLGSRTYDPSKSSFLQPDHFQTGAPAQDLSLGTDPLTRNLYTYVDGDPVNNFDPSGHCFTSSAAGADCITPCELHDTCGEQQPSPTPPPPPTPPPDGTGCSGPHAEALGCDDPAASQSPLSLSDSSLPPSTAPQLPLCDIYSLVRSICSQSTDPSATCSVYPCVPSDPLSTTDWYGPDCPYDPFGNQCSGLYDALSNQEKMVREDLLDYPDQTGPYTYTCEGDAAATPPCMHVLIDKATLQEIQDFRGLVDATVKSSPQEYHSPAYEANPEPAWLQKVYKSVILSIPDAFELGPAEPLVVSIEVLADVYDWTH